MDQDLSSQSFLRQTKVFEHRETELVVEVEISPDRRLIAVRSNTSGGVSSTSVGLYSLGSGRQLSCFSGIPFHFSKMTFLEGSGRLALVSFQQVYTLSVSGSGELKFHGQTQLPRYVLNRIKVVGNFIVRYVSDQVCLWEIEPFKQVFQTRNLSTLDCSFDRFSGKFYFKTFLDNVYKLVMVDPKVAQASPKTYRAQEVCALDQRDFSLAFSDDCKLLGVFAESFLLILNASERKILRKFDNFTKKSSCESLSLHQFSNNSFLPPDWTHLAFFGTKNLLEFSESPKASSPHVKYNKQAKIYTCVEGKSVSIYKSNENKIIDLFTLEKQPKAYIVRHARRPLTRKLPGRKFTFICF